MHDGYCYFTIDDGKFYIDYIDTNDNDTLKRRPIAGVSVEYIEGTQTASTNAWTGVTRDNALYKGKIIAYKLPKAGTSSAATLNLTLSNGTTSGAKAIKRQGASSTTTHYPAGTVIFMAYDGTYWQVNADYDSDTNTFVTQSVSTSTDWRKVLLHYTANTEGGAVPAEVTNKVYASEGIEVQPSTGTLKATKFKGPLEGNADTATEFSSNANVTLTGDVSGSANSKKGWNITTTLATTGVTAGSYGPSENATPAYGATFNVPYITVDTKGRITAASTKTVKIPASDNTDTKVTQKLKSDDNDYRIILSYEANDTDNITNTVNKASNLRYNPSLNKLSTGNIALTGTLAVTGAATFADNATVTGQLTSGSLLVNGNSSFINDVAFTKSPTAPTPAKATNDTTVATTAFVKTITGDYLPLAGGTLTGQLKWTSNSLPSVTSADYFLVIDAFASGGATKYITKANAIKTMVGSSAIGSSTKPIYWTGSAFSEITSYSGEAALTGTPTAPTAATGTNTTQIATTEFVMNAFTANDAMVFKGVVNSASGLPATHYQGWTYKVGTAGSYVGTYCEIGDLIICVTDGTSANNAHWAVIQNNVDGAVFMGHGGSAIGDLTQPVYVKANGEVTAGTALKALAYKDSISYTPAGTIANTSITPEGTISSTSITPAGTNAKSAVTIKATTTDVYSMTSAGSVTAGAAASLSMSVVDEVLSFSWTTNTPTVVTLPGRSSVIKAWTGYTTGVDNTYAAAQAFTGTAASHNHTFTGTAVSHNHTFTGTAATLS